MLENETNNAPLRLKTKQEGSKTLVFDPVRRRYVTLTPEEMVRQTVVDFLINQKGYPASCIGNEVSLTLNGMQKRCDTVVYDNEAKPLMIIEYKAPTVPITQKVFDQAWRYNSRMRVPYIIVTNGADTYCCKMNYEKNTTEFLSDIPKYTSPLHSEDVP